MTFTPDKRLVGIALAALAFGGPLAAAPGEDDIAEAVAALARGDGVAAEMAGKRALDAGAGRDEVSALIGQGEYLQGDLRDAREWLEAGEFDAATFERGWHTLALIELADGNFDAASAAFDRLIESGDASALVWVDIARMRYASGDHHGSLDAAREAVRMDSQEPRAVEYLALLVRDAQGLGAALPVLRDALEVAPEDIGLLEQYAATLGDAGRHRQMLGVVRHMLDVSPGNPRAFYLQAILAARAGEDDLARRLLWKTGGAFDETAVGLMLKGVLEFRSGNFALAAEEFDAMRRLQPFNETALLLQARAHLANGEGNETIALLEAHAERPDASNYLLTLIGRAHEQLGERQKAAGYLDRASRRVPVVSRPIPAFLTRDGNGRVVDRGNPVTVLREMLSEGRYSEAQEFAGEFGDRFPGSIDVQVIRGDVYLLSGQPERALAQYREAAVIRRNWPLMQRMVAAMKSGGDEAAARRMLGRYLAANPRDAAATAMLGRMQRDAGNPARATAFLRHAAAIGGGASDPLLLTDLAETEMLLGNLAQAQERAEAANRIQRSSRRVAQVLAHVWEMRGDGAAVEEVLAAKVQGVGASAPESS